VVKVTSFEDSRKKIRLTIDFAIC